MSLHLETLKGLEAEEALKVLAATAHSLLPNPGVGSAALMPFDVAPDRQEAVVRELRRKLRLAPDDLSQKARTAVLEALSTQMTELALRGKDLREIEARLRAKGLLDRG